MFARITLLTIFGVGSAMASWSLDWAERHPISAHVTSKSMEISFVSGDAEVALIHDHAIWYYELGCGNEWTDPPQRNSCK
ncbi:MAG: hypothetical protein IPP40_15345 [bacterium]|nr:hypothetical protein [bacterium]